MKYILRAPYAIGHIILFRKRPPVVVWDSDASEPDCQRYDYHFQAKWQRHDVILDYTSLGSEFSWRITRVLFLREYPLHRAFWKGCLFPLDWAKLCEQGDI